MPDPVRDRNRGERLSAAVNDLIAQLRVEGRARLADELAGAWAAAGSYTAGWALFVEAIDSDAGLNASPAARPESRRQ